MKRILLGGVLAGVIVFVVSALNHTVLPTGHMGLEVLPSEEPVLAAMRAAIPDKGLYIFPGMDMRHKPTDEEMKAWTEKYVAGPTGMLVYSPGGEQPKMAPQLSSELLTDILAGCIAAFIVSLTAASFGRRVLLVTLLGVFAWLTVTVSYGIWYRFPGAYVVGEGIDQIVGWFLGGLVIAWIYRSRP